MKLITHLHLVPSLRIVELCLHSPVHLNGEVLNHTENFTLSYLITVQYELMLINVKNNIDDDDDDDDNPGKTLRTTYVL
jgi:hypothetical protein